MPFCEKSYMPALRSIKTLLRYLKDLKKQRIIYNGKKNYWLKATLTLTERGIKKAINQLLALLSY